MGVGFNTQQGKDTQMQFGSFNNQLAHNTVVGTKIEIGMGATLLHWSDRTAGTVIEWDGKTLTVQEDAVKRIDTNGLSEVQEYEYTRDPNGGIHTFRLDRKGGWREARQNEKGRWILAPKGGGLGLQLGVRRQYYDFSF